MTHPRKLITSRSSRGCWRNNALIAGGHSVKSVTWRTSIRDRRADLRSIGIFAFTVFLLLSYGVLTTEAATVIPRETDETPVEGYEGLPVAPFEARTVSGSRVSSREFGGKVLIIDLWGLNCVSCLEEMKALERIYRDYRGKGLVIWALNTGMEDAHRITEGLRNKGVEVSYDLLLDPDLEITKLFTSWFIPVTVIVDSQGVVQYYKVGFKDADAETIGKKVGVLLEE